ncbi:hypothetical protein J8L88_01635 [Aquimarina sp. MMG015]|uniref:hypothetical protein n=1 Tax=unclassified Aquimarina TaxID=2627091 RepID=UPI000E50AE6F|nr:MULTISPECIES: hypothetical protein [unclassified Aquimarina]AXT57231.1 hypothetical protein D1815_16310 [Aquimarina sp. AD1]MBQ4801535.1 hypothetical protein [Aquimarina sp. MMG015]RKN11125.1 hypothetical protein D7035_19225 [Aquimarina sp. AD1]
MKNLVKCLIIVTISLFIFSCSDGEDGAVGLAGQNGIDGVDGVDGDTGTANVIYSDWIPNGFSVGGGLNQKVFTLANSQEIIDLDIDLDISVVLVYARGESVLLAVGLEAVPLPYEYRSEEQLYTYSIDSGQIRVLGLVTGGNSNDFDFFEDYRYVIIPGGVAAGKSVADYKNMTYEEIVDLFNIK